MSDRYEPMVHIHRFAIRMVLVWMCLAAVSVLPDTAQAANESDKKGPAALADAFRMEGRWVRPDGGYVLELSNMAKDGTMTAAYFNPRQINVSQALWSVDEGTIVLFVELRDINYPGSKYSLRYDPASDWLMGSYFQAVERQIYSVAFRREK